MTNTKATQEICDLGESPSRPFVRAFVDWFAAFADPHDILVIELRTVHNPDEIKLLIGDGTL